LFAVCAVVSVAGQTYLDGSWTARQFVTGQSNSQFGPVGLVFDLNNHFFFILMVLVFIESMLFFLGRARLSLMLVLLNRFVI